MTADRIIKLLRAKHSEDVFVDECKDGPTQSVSNYSKLDAWVMPRSWSHPHLTGYEVKVSRSDFIGDEKWRKYLPLCNYLYFVAPPGVILAGELSPEVGYLEVSATGGRLFTKKKAQHRTIADPTQLFRYVLMCRARVGAENASFNRKSFWAEWLEHQRTDAIFSHSVSKKIREVVEREIQAVGRENKKLKEQMEQYDRHRDLLKKLGLSDDASEWVFENKLSQMRKGLTRADEQTIDDGLLLMQRLSKMLRPSRADL